MEALGALLKLSETDEFPLTGKAVDGLQLLAVHEGANLRDIFATYQRPKA